jgi:thiamine-monophosphate kinase
VSPEFSLITEQIMPSSGQRKEVILGIGDDAALVEGCGERDQVIAMDTLVAGRHFFPDQSAFDVGWKALAVNLSDLASMGAEPKYALLSLSLPNNDQRVAWVTEFMRGWRSLAETTNLVLIGGDTTSSPVLSISVTVIGERPSLSRAMLRHSAKLGDDLWVSGEIGSAGLALVLSLAGQQPSDALAQSLHRPQPRLALGQRLFPLVHAAMDVSDGLLADLTHILRASGLGAILDWHAIPMRDEVKAWAREEPCLPLTAGDDYELLFSAAPELKNNLLALAETTHTPIHLVGRLIAEPELQVIKDGKALILPQRLGFDHFLSSAKAV